MHHAICLFEICLVRPYLFDFFSYNQVCYICALFSTIKFATSVHFVPLYLVVVYLVLNYQYKFARSCIPYTLSVKFVYI
jgi:hypothetical protein